MGEQGTTQLPAPRSSPPAQGGGGKRASVARTVEAATPIRQAISRVGMPPTNFTKHFARYGALRSSLLASGPSFGQPKERTCVGYATVRHQRRQRSIVQRSTRTTGASPPSAPRSLRGRRGVQESAAALASRGFRLLKIPSGSAFPQFQTATTLQPLCRKGYPHLFRALHGPCVAVAKLPGSACATGIVAL